MKYVYSIDREKFMDLEDTQNEIDENNSEDENIKITAIYRGEKISQTHSNFFDIDCLIDDIANSAYDEFDDFAEIYCEDLANKKCKKELEKVILDYLDNNINQPTFYKAINIKEVSIKELDNA